MRLYSRPRFVYEFIPSWTECVPSWIEGLLCLDGDEGSRDSIVRWLRGYPSGITVAIYTFMVV